MARRDVIVSGSLGSPGPGSKAPGSGQDPAAGADTATWQAERKG